MIKGLLIYAYSLCILLPQLKPAHTRHQLTLALNNSRVTDSLYNSLSTLKTKTPLDIGYLGALEALKAKHAWNPYSKLKYLKLSEKTFGNAVAADPHNIEIRFLRFSVEHNVPAFLGDNKHLYADREEMISGIKRNHYTTDDKSLVITIIKFLLDSKRCTAAENAYLSKALSRLL